MSDHTFRLCSLGTVATSELPGCSVLHVWSESLPSGSYKIRQYCCPSLVECEHSLCSWQMPSQHKWQLRKFIWFLLSVHDQRPPVLTPLQTAPQPNIKVSVSMTKSGSCGRNDFPLSRFVLSFQLEDCLPAYHHCCLKQLRFL